ncbi:MAG: hypothetical protein JRJ87_17575 [Deltaproteobacteria bacterium]|nr:hypothetical protein [Deltaproteobacteria bacterium]
MSIKRRSLKVLLVAITAFALAITGCKVGERKAGDSSSKGGAAKTAAKSTVSEKAKVEFYVMSMCPFGVKVEDAIAPVIAKMGGDIDFSIDFIGGVKGDKLTSLHKEPEVKGNMAQICAAKYAPEGAFDMVLCMNKNYRKIPNNWEGCARDGGLPVDKIRACYDGQEGKDLLKASFDKAKARRASGSPTMYIGGKLYRGGRTEKAFTRAICQAFPKDKPEICSSIPPPVKFPVTILSDVRCRECRTGMIEQQMKSMFPGAEVKIVDWGTEEGKKLYTDMKLTKLPVMLFGKDVQKAENYARLQRSLKPMGDYLVHARWGRFNPNKEICDNKKDDTNNGKVDCDDSDCEHAKACRKEKPKKLELFVMSQCPYGVKALDAMKEVIDNFKNDFEFHINFIASEEGKGFRALHGQPEVDENIRELCAIKHYPKNYKYMDYILCRNKSIRSPDWKPCTGGNTGIATNVIEKCFSGDEGKNLLRKNIKIAEGLNVTGSPTWYANNLHKFSGLDPESIKNNLCRYNKGMANCDKKLTGPDKRMRKGGGGACK